MTHQDTRWRSTCSREDVLVICHLNNEIEVSVYPQENIKVINNITFEVDLLQKNNTGKV